MQAIIVLIILIAASFAFGQHGHGSHGAHDKKSVWLDDGLGNVDHPVTTRSTEAQKFFNQGLAYLYAFNHAEGVKSFRHAAELDPDMAMAYWGIALGLGSNYNVSADEAQLVEAYENLQKAIALSAKASQADRDYIAALSKRYAKDPKTDRQKLANDYKQAMGELVKKYPDDLDAATLYAESMMNLRPWQLWTLDGQPAEGTPEIVAVLEGVLKRNPKHTGANHYYIHAIEASPNPEKGLAATHRLLGLAPSAGHLVHMPSHIYLRTGDFDDAVKSNELAIVADRKYIQRSGATGVYPLMYYNHNIHMLAASHAGNGNYAGAIKAARELETNVAPHVRAMPMLEMFMPYTLVTLSRFHKWDEVMKYPRPAAELKITNAIWRMARGLALAETGKVKEAEGELAALREVLKTFPADAGLGNSSARSVLKVADELLAGEIALSRGDRAGIDALRRAVAAEDVVNYNEPPDWHLPTREWLGRTLMRDGQYAAAEAVFRKEIEKNPKNGRALFGLAEALGKQGKTTSADLVRKEAAAAWKSADTKLTADVFDGKRSAANVKSNKAKLNTGVSISYKELGDPKGPALLLVHGYGDSSFSFSRTAPMLDQRYRIIVPDQRGHGESDKPESGYSMKDFAADLAGLMDALNVKSATVVGHSMGSFVSMQLALDHPSKVERLVLIGSAATPNNKVVKELQTVVNELRDPVPQEFIREFQAGASSPSLPKEFFDGVIDASSKVPANVWKRIAAGLLATDYTAELRRIKVPVTIFWGEKETIFSREEQEPLLKGLPNAKFIVYPNSGHAPNWEEPEKFAKDLNQILAERTMSVE